MVRKQPQKKQIKFRVNEEIKVREIRLTGDNAEPSVMETSEALKIAKGMGLDLVEINAVPNPSICKILDYDKYLFDEKKKKKDLDKKRKGNSNKPKEIIFGFNGRRY